MLGDSDRKMLGRIMRKAFSPPNGPLLDKDTPKAEQEALSFVRPDVTGQ